MHGRCHASEQGMRNVPCGCAGYRGMVYATLRVSLCVCVRACACACACMEEGGSDGRGRHTYSMVSGMTTARKCLERMGEWWTCMERMGEIQDETRSFSAWHVHHAHYGQIPHAKVVHVAILSWGVVWPAQHDRRNCSKAKEEKKKKRRSKQGNICKHARGGASKATRRMHATPACPPPPVPMVLGQC